MAEQTEVDCKILRFENNSKGGQNVFIECSIGQRTWIKEVWCNYDRPISMEEFKSEISQHIWPKNEDDNLRYIKEEAQKPFSLLIDRQNEQKGN